MAMTSLKKTTLVIIGSLVCFSATNTVTNVWAQETNTILKANTSEPYKTYLKANEVADSLALLPPPPAQDSAAFRADEEAYHQGQKLINTPRWALAQSDANLADSNIGKPFAQALGVTISKEDTPVTYSLLRHIIADSGVLGTDKAKNHYQRERPFMFYKTQTCWPQDDEMLRHDGSYPSGHSAFGWSQALVLAEMFPEKQNALLQRGYDFGQSRVICGAHWQSDVNAGRVIGAEIVARLHNNADFMADFQKAKEELSQKMKEQK